MGCSEQGRGGVHAGMYCSKWRQREASPWGCYTGQGRSTQAHAAVGCEHVVQQEGGHPCGMQCRDP